MKTGLDQSFACLGRDHRLKLGSSKCVHMACFRCNHQHNLVCVCVCMCMCVHRSMYRGDHGG